MKKSFFFLVLGGLFIASCAKDDVIDNADLQSEGEFIAQKEAELLLENPMIEFKEPIEWAVDDFFTDKDEEIELKMPEDYSDGLETFKAGLMEDSKIWETGTFISGDYMGQTLLTVSYQPSCPCPENFYRFAYEKEIDELTLLAEYSDDDSEIYFNYKTDETTTISEFEISASLDFYENTDLNLVDANGILVMNEEDFEPEILSMEGAPFTEYFELNGCLYGLLGDGMAARYMIVPEAFSDSTSEYGLNTTKEFTFTSHVGDEPVTKEYSLSAGGCGFGFGACLHLTTATEDEEGDLVQSGRLGDMDTYTFKSLDYDQEAYEAGVVAGTLTGDAINAYYEYKMQTEYDESDAEPMTIEEFFGDDFAFFLKLDNGKYLLVRDATYTPAVECGKPVIYLYPTTDTIVNVKVGVEEFTVTEPLYGSNGWTVLAKPSGLLTNLADNLTYPYLFWEGKSYGNLSAPLGWTLKKSEVDAKLPVALAGMGLNKKEIADFMEFWGPKLAELQNQYIEFSFIEQKVFDKIAPLYITPKPDNILRVFMYYRGVNEPGLSMKKYRAHSRNGFTVVEWGGILY